MSQEILGFIMNRTLSANQIAEKLVELSERIERDQLLLLAEKAFKLRPAMPILGNVLLMSHKMGPRRAKELLARSTEEAVNHALKNFWGVKKVVTISNSSLVRGFLLKLRPKLTLALKSGPGEEGRALAYALRDEGLEVALVEDSALFYACSKADLVVCGADALYEDGFLNKIGTRPLALCARELETPFLVISTGLKYAPTRLHPEDYYEELNGTPLFEFVPKDDNMLLCLEDGVGGWRYRHPHSK